MQNTRFKLWGFSQPGLQEIGGEIEKKWSKTYGKSPYHVNKAGFYMQPNVDTLRTNLYDPGKLAVVYLKHKVYNNNVEFTSEVSSSVNPYSDWSFNRVTFSSTFKLSDPFSVNNILKYAGFTYGGYRGRLFVGKIWTNEQGVPNQEAYNIEGNSSADMFRLSYLRNEDSFFGLNNFNNNYHLPGDGNIRGFLNLNENSADAGASVSGEIFMINKRVDVLGYLDDRSISFELAAFADAGAFYAHGDIRNIADAGLGIRFKSNFYNKPLYLRIDFPFMLLKNGESINNSRSWVVSFQTGV